MLDAHRVFVHHLMQKSVVVMVRDTRRSFTERTMSSNGSSYRVERQDGCVVFTVSLALVLPAFSPSILEPNLFVCIGNKLTILLSPMMTFPVRN